MMGNPSPGQSDRSEKCSDEIDRAEDEELVRIEQEIAGKSSRHRS
jgi:hypothetical protein